ncbi:hypothetical protein PV10_08843 [Exophiala mesophila]|uniref:Uncharacterized protein n=1 Tax=Exophiala mesophila TaxID=212818 RepID=A0A0D1Z5U6_EXOME|nr:uncharacterized protein PV10_08843 [Exophiala mesophila]KIV89264.1 hypothetical protein PV10_08843 [Exophiala mesophila]
MEERSPNTITRWTSTSQLSLPATTKPPSPSNPPKPKVWIIFGATGHMGRSMTKAALQHNDHVTAVGQCLVDTQASVQNWHPDPSRYLGLLCDVRIRSTVAAVIEKTIAHFGRVDIIANSTGYGVIGACEDQDEAEIRNQFETNFMGTLNIIQLSLPYFRRRQYGRYLILSSTSGSLGVPGQGLYCASKYAVEGLIESMLYEVDGFNIRPTLVEPGHLRRDDTPIQPLTAGNSTAITNNNHTSTQAKTNNSTSKASALPIFGHFKVAKPSEPYTTKDSPAAHAKRTLQWMGENQPVSSVKAAELVWQLGHCSYPPLRLLLGNYAVESIRDRLKTITEEIEDWKHLAFPPLEGFEEKDGDEDDEDDDQDDDAGAPEDDVDDDDADDKMDDSFPDLKKTTSITPSVKQEPRDVDMSV